MNKYKVTFKWSETTYCTNIAIAESEDIVREYYESKYKEVLSVSSVSDGEYEEAERKGMPIIFVK